MRLLQCGHDSLLSISRADGKNADARAHLWHEVRCNAMQSCEAFLRIQICNTARGRESGGKGHGSLPQLLASESNWCLIMGDE